MNNKAICRLNKKIKHCGGNSFSGYLLPVEIVFIIENKEGVIRGDIMTETLYIRNKEYVSKGISGGCWFYFKVTNVSRFLGLSP